MKRFIIFVFIIADFYRVCEWEAESEDEAIEEFKKANPRFKDHRVRAREQL